MDDDDYDELEEFLERYLGEPKTPSLLGDAETTRPLNINARPEPLPSQVQDLDQSRLFGYNEPNVSLCETRNKTAQFQRGHSQSQELNTPFEAESVNSLLASTETDQNLYTVPPHNFGYGEPIGSSCETSNMNYQLQRGNSQSQELHTSSVDQAESSLLASIDIDQALQTLLTLPPLPPLNIGFNEPSGGSSVAADSSQQQFSANLPMWHQNQLNIGSFDPGTPLFTAPSFINPAVRKFHVTVKFPSKQFTVEVDRTETVSSLKDKIHIVENTPIKRMQLYYSGIELADDYRNLNEYGISEFSEIVVFLKPINRAKDVAPVRKLCFLVQTSSSLFNGARIPVEIKDTCTISEMREGLQANKTLPRDEYIFIHKQRVMRETCSLRWHGVENGDTLFVFKGSISREGY